MKTIQKVSKERLAQMLPGALLKLGNQIVTFDGCNTEPDYKNRPAEFVHYTDSQGVQRRFDIGTVIQSATEHLDAEACDYCGKLRLPEDLKKVSIQFYKHSELHTFCHEGNCVALYQSTVGRPRASVTVNRRASWAK
ncbi:hypothetical protein [Yersinia enterocolitica]|uniref:Hypothetical phage protein n=1 Tax=Yersinia enterocolitica serotype O:8 / biotype 1B (strain NCTC 13174 / 8081) TaxID=393305 RepID=A1JR76_YERE8|nr:hypothetical protein [Yersinia enterocolitica]AJJ22178.1 hypothetical protein CH49_1776 [Yersinia enterocolitica]CAL12408.1 hypothetical phage protein [Yersinia enterocolitica subsp. enterocolitica 8081]HDL6628084.1 hypothetical protein [Yersinia enterocolitica]HDL6654031.1 hypothetical protein [Yersinia enterocolitica]HDL6680148.1 hypothetical protein [Yersinia enterocolitica]